MTAAERERLERKVREQNARSEKDAQLKGAVGGAS